jgi:MinD-like ATPase involved in chromosome partitioning or flagellar assembly
MRSERSPDPETSTPERDARHDAPAVFLFTTHPLLDPLERGLQALGLNAMRVRSLAHARQLLAGRRDRCVAVLDTYQPAPYSFAAIYRFLHEAPAVPTLIVLHGEPTGPSPIWATTPNTDDYARLPMPLAALQLRVQALLLHAGLPLPPPETSSAASEAPRRPAGKLVAVFGAKGGLGCSTIAANLAVALAQHHDQRVALIDANLWFGNLATLLDVRGDKTLATLAATADHLDVDVLTDVLVPHASGVQLLLPPKPTQVETIPPSLPARVAQAYRLLFDYVIVDTHPSLEEYVLQVLEGADQILLVTTPELAAIGCTAQVLALAPALGLRNKLLLVLNRANSGVRLEHLEHTLGMRVDATIVSAGQRVVSAANRGVPLVALDPQGTAQVTRDLVALANRLRGATEPDEQRAPSRSAWRLPDWTPRLLPRPALVS